MFLIIFTSVLFFILDTNRTVVSIEWAVTEPATPSMLSSTRKSHRKMLVYRKHKPDLRLSHVACAKFSRPAILGMISNCRDANSNHDVVLYDGSIYMSY